MKSQNANKLIIGVSKNGFCKALKGGLYYARRLESRIPESYLGLQRKGVRREESLLHNCQWSYMKQVCSVPQPAVGYETDSCV